MMEIEEKRVWLNGRIVAEGQALVPVSDRGFLFGDGVFETIRADGGKVYFLDEHVERLRSGAKFLRIDFPSGTDFRSVISGLLRENGLEAGAARIKIVLSRGSADSLGLPAAPNPTLLITADPYTPPTRAEYLKGWKLHTLREPFYSPLAEHKTLSYLFYAAARQEAADCGANDALITSPDGSVLETSLGSVLVSINGTWLAPGQKGRLRAITEPGVARILSESGCDVQSRAISIGSKPTWQSLWVTNSLVGVMPVYAIDENELELTRAEEAGRVRARLFGAVE